MTLLLRYACYLANLILWRTRTILVSRSVCARQPRAVTHVTASVSVLPLQNQRFFLSTKKALRSPNKAHCRLICSTPNTIFSVLLQSVTNASPYAKRKKTRLQCQNKNHAPVTEEAALLYTLTSSGVNHPQNQLNKNVQAALPQRTDSVKTQTQHTQHAAFGKLPFLKIQCYTPNIP